MRCSVLTCAVLILSCTVSAQKSRVDSIQPNQFEIGQRTFFDFGPPFDYYALFLVRPAGNGASIERIILTPAGDECFAPAKLETASGLLSESVASLLGQTNPCTIPEKELRRELKRCKHCLVFSGAVTEMQVQCGTKMRLIRADILDRDMFDPNANTPEHTSRTMRLLKTLDQAVGPGVMDKPMFAIPAKEEPTSKDSDPAALRDLSAGKYDPLFPDAPDKPSDLYRAAQRLVPPPTVQLVSSTPFAPEVFIQPEYPAIARMAHVEGLVSFNLEIDANGYAITIIPFLTSGPPLLHGAVNKAVRGWRFPKDAIGQQIQVTLKFSLNCPKRTEQH